MIPCRGGTGFISPPDSTNLVLHFSIKHTILIHFGSSWLIFWHPCFWTTYLSHWQTHIFWHACGHIGKGSFGLPHYCTRGTGTGTVTGPGPSGAKRGPSVQALLHRSGTVWQKRLGCRCRRLQIAWGSVARSKAGGAAPSLEVQKEVRIYIGFMMLYVSIESAAGDWAIYPTSTGAKKWTRENGRQVGMRVKTVWSSASEMG